MKGLIAFKRKLIPTRSLCGAGAVLATLVAVAQVVTPMLRPLTSNTNSAMMGTGIIGMVDGLPGQQVRKFS